MSVRNRQRFLNPFGLAFLDVMSCGLGAAVLLFLIIDHNLTEQAVASETGEEDVQVIEEAIEQQQKLSIQHRLQTKQLQKELEQLSDERVETLVALAEARSGSAEEVDTEELERQLREKQEQLQQAKESQQLRDISGEGQRQYVAGFRITGKRVLFLLDRSASMQDEKIATIIYNQFLPNETQRQSSKWLWARSILEWMLAALPKDAQYQVWGFSKKYSPVISSRSWMNASNEEDMRKVIEAVGRWVPKDGTRLDKMLNKVKNMRPAPDTVYIITDGLPTQGSSWFKKSKVSPEKRKEFFLEATTKIMFPRFNVVLLPLEGDPEAAGLYWRFAMRTGGQFLAPSKEWP